jgi:hypothetical protein
VSADEVAPILGQQDADLTARHRGCRERFMATV